MEAGNLSGGRHGWARGPVAAEGAAECGCGTGAAAGALAEMLFLFSNRLGCLGSLAISVLGTLLLLALFGVI